MLFLLELKVCLCVYRTLCQIALFAPNLDVGSVPSSQSYANFFGTLSVVVVGYCAYIAVVNPHRRNKTSPAKSMEYLAQEIVRKMTIEFAYYECRC